MSKGKKMTEHIHGLVDRGFREARFAFEPNAQIFAKLLVSKGFEARIYKIMGHAPTVENIQARLKQHFLVVGQAPTHKVINNMLKR